MHGVHVSDCFDSDKQNIVHLVAYIYMLTHPSFESTCQICLGGVQGLPQGMLMSSPLACRHGPSAVLVLDAVFFF